MNQVNAHNEQSATTRPRRSRRTAHLSTALSVGLDPVDSSERQELEACIAQRFDQQYDARIRHFLPYLLSLKESDQLGAVVGMRLAGQAELFLERYLDSSVEQAISRVVRQPIDRGQVVEIGNLASALPGTASVLFAILATVLHRAGIRWVACTATPQVQAMLQKMQFSTHRICSADAAALGDQADEWGNYYASRPQVIVGSTQQAVETAARNPALRALLRKLDDQINRFARELRTARQ